MTIIIVHVPRKVLVQSEVVAFSVFVSSCHCPFRHPPGGLWFAAGTDTSTPKLQHLQWATVSHSSLRESYCRSSDDFYPSSIKGGTEKRKYLIKDKTSIYWSFKLLLCCNNHLIWSTVTNFFMHSLHHMNVNPMGCRVRMPNLIVLIDHKQEWKGQWLPWLPWVTMERATVIKVVTVMNPDSCIDL